MAVLSFVAACGLGMFMSMTHQYQFTTVHVHINLPGWASMGIIAALYRVFPALEESRLAAVHFWVYQVGFTLMMGSLLLMAPAKPQGETTIPVGGTITVIGVILTAVTVWRGVFTWAPS